MAKQPIYDHSKVMFGENLFDVLPKNYQGNHAALPKEQRDAIAEDFRRWRLAEEMFKQRRQASSEDQAKKANKRIVEGLAILEPAQYREDMRRRLNILKGTLK